MNPLKLSKNQALLIASPIIAFRAMDNADGYASRPREVNTNRKKSRRTTILLLCTLGMLVLVFVFMHSRMDRAASASFNSSDGSPSPISVDSTSVNVRPLPTIRRLANGAPAAANPARPASKEPKRGAQAYLPELIPPPVVVAFGASSTAFGVVDLERLFAARESAVDAKDARAKILQDISHVVALRAAAHGFGFVFDTSARSSIGTPLVVATNGVPDITGEVLQELSK